MGWPINYNQTLNKVTLSLAVTDVCLRFKQFISTEFLHRNTKVVEFIKGGAEHNELTFDSNVTTNRNSYPEAKNKFFLT